VWAEVAQGNEGGLSAVEWLDVGESRTGESYYDKIWGNTIGTKKWQSQEDSSRRQIENPMGLSGTKLRAM